MSAQTKVVTKWFIVAIIVLIGVYDLIAKFAFGYDATISSVLGVEASFETPTIPFAVGFIMGHLFWPQKVKVTE